VPADCLRSDSLTSEQVLAQLRPKSNHAPEDGHEHAGRKIDDELLPEHDPAIMLGIEVKTRRRVVQVSLEFSVQPKAAHEARKDP
jgi:hypothetical protein